MTKEIDDVIRSTEKSFASRITRDQLTLIQGCMLKGIKAGLQIGLHLLVNTETGEEFQQRIDEVMEDCDQRIKDLAAQTKAQMEAGES